MTTALADAFLALLPDDWPVHDGHVPDGHVVPYLWVRTHLPDASSRSLSRDPQSLRLDATVTFVAATAPAVRSMFATVRTALEGARPVAAGWSTSPVICLNARDVTEDTDVVIPGTSRHPVYAVTEWRFTASRAA